MAKIGYLYKAEEDNNFDEMKEWMDEYGCVRVMIEESADEKLRPRWKQLMELLNRGDELVLSKFSNAVRSTIDLSNLIEYCRVKAVRLISIGDCIDSAGTLFPKTSAAQVLNIVGALPEETVALRQQKAHIISLQRAAKARIHKVSSKSDREQTVVNMYHQGHSIDDIWKVSGFSSRASVFRVLNRHGVTLNRGKFSGPLGPRKKKDLL